MKTTIFFILLFLFTNVSAQPYMVQDINTSPNIFFGNGAQGEEGTLFQDWYYFAGYDSLHGGELWKTNGDTALLVHDLWTGFDPTNINKSSFPLHFIVFNNLLYFTARDSVEGYEIWQYNGINPPQLVNWLNFSNINNAQGSTGYFKVYNNKLIFVYNYNGNMVLKEFDGFSVNTILSTALSYSNLYVFNNKLYVVGACYPCDGLRLWEYDGVSMNLIPNLLMTEDNLMTANWLSGYNFEYFTEFQNELYFTAYDTTHGYEIWKYDGSLASLAFETNVGPGNGAIGALITY
ncbi:hypothetical protein, partial [Putridiphycobacter roseus]|uniref:hypothetical protein n=1 Tax=Putridiphycobacter roseus TaxID=2219161 RepID=UPI00363B8971